MIAAQKVGVGEAVDKLMLLPVTIGLFYLTVHYLLLEFGRPQETIPGPC